MREADLSALTSVSTEARVLKTSVSIPSRSVRTVGLGMAGAADRSSCTRSQCFTRAARRRPRSGA